MNVDVVTFTSKIEMPLEYSQAPTKKIVCNEGNDIVLPTYTIFISHVLIFMQLWFFFRFQIFLSCDWEHRKKTVFFLIPFHSTLLSYVSVLFCVYLIAIEFVFLYNVSCLQEISQSKLVGIVLLGCCILIGRCKGKDFRWLNPISLQFSTVPRQPFGLFYFCCWYFSFFQLAVCNLRRKPSVQR